MITTATPTDRDATIREIKANLKARSNRRWSVTGGRGTSWGWITIESPPARRDEFGSMTPDDAAELARLLGLDHAHHQGVSIPASGDYRREFIERSAGRVPAVCGSPYWD